LVSLPFAGHRWTDDAPPPVRRAVVAVVRGSRDVEQKNRKISTENMVRMVIYWFSWGYN